MKTGKHALAMLLALGFSHAIWASEADHKEFEATLHAPFSAAGARGEARSFTLAFEYPHAEQAQTVRWQLDLLDARGQVLRNWSGSTRLLRAPVQVVVDWDGTANGPLADGLYTVRLRATALAGAGDESAELAAEQVEQSWEIGVGQVAAPTLPAFAGLPTAARATPAAGGRLRQGAAPAPAALPYTVYFGNLHSQTNHSDGGGVLASCTGAQNPQSGAYGPADAYGYAKGKGLDFLMASEHNHMYDGSDATNTSASPATATSLYASGLTAAASFNAANPGFLAIYGMEWGVITNGGHLNIFNADKLVGWEYNSSNQLLADLFVAKNDYASLYTLMRQNGWVGQFNHPSSSGQFLVNGVPFGYTADGDAAMALCEVLNTSAFSTNTSETETSRSTYEGACTKALEAGYHVAFSTNQDNHCANWGASYTNRTGVLIPSGTALSPAAMIAAIQARRVFATMDKNSQIVLTANGHLMGERFSNSGVLNLSVNYANSSGRSVASVVIYEGVPGRNGTPSQLMASATASITPTVGEHYYYAKITQDDGNILWSAPIWVSQGTASADTTAPTVAASESGSSGTINLAATASDNVGVTLVEFYVDSALKASTNLAPYSASLDSTTLANGSHTLVAKAYDAANNVGSSAGVAFSVNNVAADTTPPTVSASVSGSSGSITLTATASDNVGVSKVEFYVDGVLKGTDTASPWTLALDSTQLANGSHTLVAKAYDAANNSASSTALSFSVSNSSQLVSNGGFESGTSGWTASSGVITNDATYAGHGGSWKAWLNGYGSAHTDTLYQSLTLPATASKLTLSFWLRVDSAETTTTTAYDTLKVQLRNSSNSVLATLGTYSNLNKGSSYVQKSFDLSAYKGQSLRLYFEGVEGSSVATSFLIDDVSVLAQ
ncbi:Ig-like domain-containing protein [Massilia sp. TS11]|uniref:Ig-like domain-containing protein n=1 Tax=Massilia sp. TS11 TaxID=2908003 RepID=UPI001EDA9A38|nr:Ig-like domain-containing protein [Massilia sp. TS11]MCG2584818.1 CehA/McbA family metallohydrolase [Massilia sp. TS11]